MMHALSPWMPALFLAIANARASVPQEVPWDGAAFTADAKSLVAAATAATAQASADVVMLLDEASYSYDAQGRCRKVFRTVFHVLSAKGAADWATVSCEWSPWYQRRPELRARVCTKGGDSFELDPSTIDAEPARDRNDQAYGDDQVVRAPLPAIAPGAVVEQEVVLQESAPMFHAGVCERFYFGRAVPVKECRLILDVPQALPVHAEEHLLPGITADRRLEQGRQHFTWRIADLASATPPATNLPFDVAPWSYVGFSTGESWATIARAYHALVEAQLADRSMAEIARGVLDSLPPESRSERSAIAAAFLAHLHREVRYTGLEFGLNSIAPHAPSLTLRQRFGDCKDQATLMVALLNAVHVPAFVALLRSGFDEDVREALPGLGRFNHAIVYVPGDPPLWVDPTSSLHRLQSLPISDQGRLALIAAEDTTGLVRTPELAAADNCGIETREITLPEAGPARVVETTAAFGSIELAYRRDFEAATHEQLQEQLGRYVANEYQAGSLTKFDCAPAEELSLPYWTRVEASDARCGFTDENRASVTLPLRGLWNRLPRAITDAQTEGEAAKPRAADFVTPEPFAYEHRYRVMAPPGFVARELPASEAKDLGPARLRTSYQVAEDGSVTASLRFESGPRRISASEFEALRAAVAELERASTVSIVFDQAGMAHLERGEVREALDEFRKLMALHPAEALHHTQVAMALLQAGLGDSARAAAREATRIEPGSAIAHRTLAWVLQHDLVGRLRGVGFDRDQAIAEYRTAKALDARDFLSRADLAILLEYDLDGHRYTSGARLAEAIDEYRALRADLEDGRMNNNLLAALLRARRPQELKELALELEASDARDPALVAAIGAIDGAPAALKEAMKLAPAVERRRTILTTAAQQLNLLRKYREATALIEEAARGAPNAAALSAWAAQVAKAKAIEKIALAEDDPASVVKRFFIWMFAGADLTLEKFTSFFTDEVAKTLLTRQNEGELLGAVRQVRKQLLHTGLPLDTVSDFTLAVASFTVDGSADLGYRVRIRTSVGNNPLDEVAFVTRRADGFHLVASGNAVIAMLGIEALYRLDHDDVAGAKWWLDHAREAIAAPGGDDPLAGAVFPRFWRVGQEAATDAMRLAAVSLLVDTPGAETAIPVLLAAKANATEALRSSILLALAHAYATLDRHAEALDMARALYASHPRSPTAFQLLAITLRYLKRFADLETVVAERLSALPGDVMTQRARVTIAIARGDRATAEKIYRDFMANGEAGAVDLNQLAWLRLFTPPVTAADIEIAQRAVGMMRPAPPTIQHTLAALYAEIGKCTEARDVLWQAIEARGHTEPSDWLVLGRIAEQLGEHDAARALYQRVARDDAPLSSWALAQQRLVE